jgi:hypothetical protein
MQPWVVVLGWCVNVLVLSLILAVFEILIERENGWASAANPNGWGRRLFSGSIISRICEKHYLTVYHVVMFALVVPCILVGELLLLPSAAAGHHLFPAPKSYLVMLIGPVRVMPILFLGAAWFLILAVEDVLWFVLNWYYPSSMDDLLSGKIWWHTRWVTVGPINLPRFYLTTPLMAFALLTASLGLPG